MDNEEKDKIDEQDKNKSKQEKALMQKYGLREKRLQSLQQEMN